MNLLWFCIPCVLTQAPIAWLPALPFGKKGSGPSDSHQTPKTSSKIPPWLRTRTLLFWQLFFWLFQPLGAPGLQAQTLSFEAVSSLSDAALIDYWKQAQTQGYDWNDLVAQALSNGVSQEQINQLRERIFSSQISPPNAVNTAAQTLAMPNHFGRTQTASPTQRSPIFGADFFTNPHIEWAPALNMATPSNYQLGPGDILLLEIWGAAAQTYQLEVNRDGRVFIPDVGPTYLSGLTVAQARRKLKNNLIQIYAGIQNTRASERVFFDLSLSQARSIIVNIVGQVNVPGTYTLNGFTSPLNALYACGGIHPLGSFRKIEIIRNGKRFKTIDLYDYLINGIPPQTLLRDQDILRVPFYTNHITTQGAFKDPKVFELLADETVSDLLTYSGGFTEQAHTAALTLERIQEGGRRIWNIPQEAYAHWTFQNGDRLVAKTVGEDYLNRVLLEGAVNREGTYALADVPTVKSLLAKAGGLSQRAFTQAALLYRSQHGVETEIRTLNLKALYSEAQDVPLRPNDRMLVLEKNTLSDREAITVQGEVQQPGSFPFYEGMTLRDALLLAGGLQSQAAQNTSLFTLQKNKKGEWDYGLQKTIPIDPELQLSEAQNPVLPPRAVVLVNRDPAHKSILFAQVQGAVHKPGKYLIKDPDYSVSDLLRDAGGLTSKATLGGIYLLRDTAPFKQKIKVDSMQLVNPTENDPVRIPIEFDKKPTIAIKKNFDFPLKENDQLVVETYFNTVLIKGDVLQETVVGHQKHLKLKHYIQAAGGYQQRAKKNKVYVISQNGKVAATKSFLGFRKHPSVEAGAVIFVPQKMEREKKSTQEILGITTALSTVGLLVRNLVN